MPKRIPTPPPPDDEPKYFTVVQPYPLNANWELPHDYITFGRWIAGCIGPEPFFALFYKPSARGQVLLEVDCSYPHFERLLGEHRWSEFLKKPTEEEKGRVSQIFYCTYPTGRAAQKDGWKRINVADSWFKNWNVVNPVIMNPYPPTAWCPPPVEDRTNKPMCRPLPVALKPPPPTKAPPPSIVPGSATWAAQKSAPPTNTATVLTGAWAAKQALASVAASNNKTNKTKAIPANSSAPWHTATAPKSSNTVPIAAKAKTAPVKTPAQPVVPPGLGIAEPSSPPGLSRGPSGASSTSTASIEVNSLADGFVGVTISPSQEANLYGAGQDLASPDPNAYVAEWEKMPIVDPETLWPAYTPVGGNGDSEWGEWDPKDGQNLWGEEAGDDKEVNKKPPDTVMCRVHGTICKKGICSEYAKMVREKEREEKEKARKEQQQRRGGGSGGGKDGWSNAGRGGNGSNKGNNGNRNNNAWKKNPNPWEDDSGSATGSEGRATSPKRDAWATVRR
ncbi:hypothetical protein R3P38DRAFT_2843746 [Favolaschia claudopus]|uniref:Uncharacterized protein n=1 Tax=Favolaschia claudopus TaxID=2862362 RepID=A0AAW0E5D6_9AGAR